MGTGTFTTTELQSALEDTTSLLALKHLLPRDLAVKLDTFQADLLAEIEDRERAEAKSKARANGAG